MSPNMAMAAACAKRGHGVLLPDKAHRPRRPRTGQSEKGRTRARPDHLFPKRGNLQGAQFFCRWPGIVYEIAKRQGLGREIPTEWFPADDSELILTRSRFGPAYRFNPKNVMPRLVHGLATAECNRADKTKSMMPRIFMLSSPAVGHAHSQ